MMNAERGMKSRSRANCFSLHRSSFRVHRFLSSVPHVYKNLHRAAADHSLFARFVCCQLEAMKSRIAVAQSFSRFSPDLSFYAAAADSSRNLAVFKEEHFSAASLWRRAARVRYGCDCDALAALLRFAD